ncbi:MAG TPA: hypothetical protein VGQ11_05985, partial [Candidatus Acidoferrales bacterium]|nr:hypothetical protein [Candidatus Acidoferrales bacterium]
MPASLGAQHAAPLQKSPSSMQQRLHLAPKLVPGQILRYQLDSHTMTTSHSSGRVENPQGPSKSEVALTATLRMEVLPAEPGAPLRVRTTYEKS